MCPQIDVDPEVFELLKEHAEPFTDTPNSVLRRLLGLEVSPSGTASGEAPALAYEARRPARRRKSRREVNRKPRAPRGALLPEAEYELPILEALNAQPKGRAPAREVLELIKPALTGKLTDLDHQPIDSGNIRWHNRAQFARLHLVKLGHLATDSPRGIWEITELGRDRVKNEQRD